MDVLFRPILWGLLALAIPVLVHLFYFRRNKKVLFTNTRLLKEVMQHTSARNKVKHWLILLSRLAALGLLILAFAQPFLKKKDQVRSGKKTVSVFVDNSYSMQSQDEDVPLFEVARSKAREIISAFDESDQFQIVTSGLDIKEKKWLSRTDAIESIDQLYITPESSALDQVLNTITNVQASSDADHKLIYLLSDFQQSQMAANPVVDTSFEVSIMPLQAVQNKNISIDSAWFLTPSVAMGQKNELIVQLTNHDRENKAETKLNYSFNGRNQPIGSLTFEPGETILDTTNIEISQSGWQQLSLKITDYPISFDDQYHLTFDIVEQLNILVIRQHNNQFNYNRLFESIPNIKLDQQVFNRINYSTLKDYNLIVLHELNSINSGLKDELIKNIHTGTNILIIPQGLANPGSYNNLLSELGCNTYLDFQQTERTIGSINTRSTTFSRVYEHKKSLLDLPTTTGNFSLTTLSNRRKETLIRYRDGSPFLIRQPVQRGQIYIQSAPVDQKWSDYLNYVEIWIPMLYNMALPANQNGELAYTVGRTSSFEISHQNESDDILYKVEGQQEFIPQQINLPNASRIVLGDQITKDGFYTLSLGDQKMRSIAMNYDRAESTTEFMASTDLERLFPNATMLSTDKNINLADIIKTENKGTPLWKYCIIFALLFLLIESLLIRFW